MAKTPIDWQKWLALILQILAQFGGGTKLSANFADHRDHVHAQLLAAGAPLDVVTKLIGVVEKDYVCIKQTVIDVEQAFA